MSLSYIGVIVSAVGFIFKLAGVPFAPEQIESAVSVVIALIGAVMTLFGRWRLGGVKWYGGRKN